MATRTAPPAPPVYAPPNEDALKDAHLRLMGAYVAALNAASHPRTAASRGIWSNRLASLLLEGWPFDFVTAAWRWAKTYSTKLLMHLHIRKQLRAIRDAYVQIAQGVNPDVAPDYRAWLRDAVEGCGAFRDSLTSLRRPSIFATVPLVLAVVASAKAAPGSWQEAFAVMASVIGLYIALLAILSLFVLFFGFGLKRRFFAPPADDPGAGRNVYREEDDLFELLGRTKSLEPQIGLMLVAPFVLAPLFVWWANWRLVGLLALVAMVVVGFGMRQVHRFERFGDGRR